MVLRTDNARSVAEYRHRKLGTADNHGLERFHGEVETIPAGDLCDFDVELRNWGVTPFWEWTDKQGEIVHAVADPDVRSKWSANGRSFWTIDEGWDYFWPNPDGTEFVEGTGTHFWVHDKHRKFRMYGTWHLLLGPESLQCERVLPRQDLRLGRHRRRHQPKDLRVPELRPASR